ncbi:MAG: hypothetical protein ACLGGV_06230 [Bacteroidia bacterium]
MKHIAYILFLVLPFLSLGQEKTFKVEKEKQERIVILDSLVDNYRVIVSVTDTLLSTNTNYKDFFEIIALNINTNEKQIVRTYSSLFYSNFRFENGIFKTNENEGLATINLFDINNNDSMVLIEEVKFEFLIVDLEK